MTTHTQTPTCPDSHACDSVIGHTPPICLCRCHASDGQRQNARHYIDEARERRTAANNLKSIAADIRDSADPWPTGRNHELLDADRIERAAELLAPQGPQRDRLRQVNGVMLEALLYALSDGDPEAEPLAASVEAKIRTAIRAAELAEMFPRMLDKWGSEIDDRNMPVTVISDTGVEQGTLHADDSITVAPEPTTPEPSIETLREWENDGKMHAVDGCVDGVEPDGACEHGAPSWMRHLNLI